MTSQTKLMITYIVVITARTQTMKCVDVFRANGVCCNVVNTPREAGVGCGISVEFSAEYYFRAKQLISQHKIGSVFAYFKCQRMGNKRHLVRID